MSVQKTRQDGRRKSRAFLGICVVAILIAIVCISLNREYISAYSWHVEHGNDVEIGSNKLTLPTAWWPESIESDGTVHLRNSVRGFNFSTSGLTVRPMQSEHTVTDEHELWSTTNAMVEQMNKGRSGSSNQQLVHSVSIKSHTKTFYCTNETLYNDEFILHCEAPGVPYEITSLGAGKWEKQSELIISTWQ
jgi:hypothetical protein